MKKQKLLTVVGTRPELIKLSCTIPKLDEHFDHVFVHTGQNFDHELNEIFYSDLGLRKPNHSFDCVGDSVVKTIANVLVETERFIEAKSLTHF